MQPSWECLGQTPGYFLNWALAGAPHVTFDTGGFAGATNSLLLARWYGVATFAPIMRVHSTIGTTPHFPFPELWGAEASAAMRALLQLRYSLLPHLYALAHEAHELGVPPTRPMLLEFPADAACANMTSQWMLGRDMLVAPVLAEDNATSAYLPAGVWFEWASARTHAGPATLTLPAVPLDAVPVFVRAGAVLALAPPITHTDALPGGPLRVAVYRGGDARARLVDDDGETMAYERGALAEVALVWDDAAACLSWTRSGAFPGDEHSFTQLQITAYGTDGTVTSAPATAIGAAGKLCPK